jgi:hypothetical protein
MSGKFRFLLLAVATILTYKFIDNPVIADTVFLGVGLVALAYNYKLVNIYSTILIIITLRAAELGMREILGDISPYLHYLTKIITDSGVIVLLVIKLWVIHLFRRTFTGSFYVEDLELTKADLLLLVIYVLYFLLSFVMVIEHFIRHLDDIPIILDGVYALVSAISPNAFIDADELAAHLYEHAEFFYNNYEYLKAALNMIEHIVILATSYQFMREKSPFRP